MRRSCQIDAACPGWDSNPHLMEFEAIASADWATGAVPPQSIGRQCRPGSCFGAHERVEERDALAPTDSDIDRVRPSPLDADRIAGVSEQRPNVVGPVGELVAGIFVRSTARPPDPVDRAAPVAVDEPAEKKAGVVSEGDRFLPWLERDRAQVLLAWCGLRQQAPPMRRIGLDVHDALTGYAPDAIVGEDRLDRSLHFIDDARICSTARDDESIDAAPPVEID